MAVKIPLKALCNGSGDTCALSEFQAADFLGVDNGGTGLITQGICEYTRPGCFDSSCGTTFLGVGAGKATLEAAKYNTMIGYCAGAGITTSCDVTLLGHKAGMAITTAALGATLVGQSAGVALTTGTGATYIGYEAGAANSTGILNTFLGYQAGNVATASCNTAVGSSTLVSLTTGIDNTAVGANTGRLLVSTNNNTFIGSNAGCVATCANNTMIGAFAGRSQTTGCQNTFIGVCAGHDSQGAQGNVVVGFVAGQKLTGGTNNVFIGQGAGQCTNNGSNNIYIGEAAGCTQTTKSSFFEVRNAGLTLMNGCFTTGDLFIPNGRVGIGTSDPTAALSVQYNPATTNGFELIDSRDPDCRVGFEAGCGELGIYTTKTGSYSAANLALSVDVSQRVGIGTSSPAATLDLQHPSQSSGYWEDKGLLIREDATADTGIALYSRGGAEHYIASLDDDANSYLIIGVRKSSAVNRIDAITVRGSGNVGIGTSSPTHKLTVEDTSGSVVRLNGINNYNYDIESHDNGQLWDHEIGSGTPKFSWSSSTAELMRLDTTGLGIGTSSPLSGLHISDGTAYGSPQNASRKGTLTISAGTEPSADLQFLNANYNHIFFGDSADANVGVLLYDHTNNSMQFAVNGSERARITSAGKVGIGTTVPNYALTIFGSSTTIEGFNICNDGGGNGGRAVFGVTGCGYGAYGVGPHETWLAVETGCALTLGDYNLNIPIKFISNGSETARFTQGNLGIGTSGPATLIHAKATSSDNCGIAKLRLEDCQGRTVEIQTPSSGADNARIGTISNHDFEINAGNGNGTNFIRFLTDSDEKMRITNAGNVGIGVNSPLEKLHIRGAAGTRLLLTNAGSAGNISAIGFDSVNTTPTHSAAVSYFDNPSDSASVFQYGMHFTVGCCSGGFSFGQLTSMCSLQPTTFNTLMSIKCTGNVGIGTSSPQRPLHIDGTEGVARFTSTASGNSGLEVGIGTSSQAFIWQTENSYLQFGTNNVERARITSAGTLELRSSSGGQVGTLQLGSDATYHAKVEWEYSNNELAHTINNVGNHTFNTNGSEVVRITSDGITFNGDTAAANALDDYEEGTWTPTFTPSTSGSITLAAGGGAYYTKIGQLVTATLSVTVASVSSPIGYVSVNLPFAPNTSNQKGRSGVAVYVDGLAAGHNTRDAIALTEDSSATLRIYQGDSNSNQSDFAQAVGAGTYFNLTVSYIV